MRDHQKGFSLIELLIVVGIILVIAAISIPSYMRAKMTANESSAVASLRSIGTAEMNYATTYPDTGFTALANLGGSASDCAAGGSETTGCFLENFLATNGNGSGKDGYTFSMTVAGSPGANYVSDAEPISDTTGSRAFCSDESGVMYYVAPNTCTPSTGAPL